MQHIVTLSESIALIVSFTETECVMVIVYVCLFDGPDLSIQ